MTARQLPPNPSLKSLKARAKQLLHGHKSGAREAREQIIAFHPRMEGRSPDALRDIPFVLADALLVIARPLGASGGTSGNGCAMDYENCREYPALLVHVAVGTGLVDREPRVIGFDDLVDRKVLHESGSARSQNLGLFSFRLPHDEAPHGAVTHLGVEVREE